MFPPATVGPGATRAPWKSAPQADHVQGTSPAAYFSAPRRLMEYLCTEYEYGATGH